MEHLPKIVCTVKKQELEPFSSGKRVGSYLIGRTIGQGSFAKVKEAMHVSTGEKVRAVLHCKVVIDFVQLNTLSFIIPFIRIVFLRSTAHTCNIK